MAGIFFLRILSCPIKKNNDKKNILILKNIKIKGTHTHQKKPHQSTGHKRTNERNERRCLDHSHDRDPIGPDDMHEHLHVFYGFRNAPPRRNEDNEETHQARNNLWNDPAATKQKERTSIVGRRQQHSTRHRGQGGHTHTMI